jgi:hypothetical protein
MVAPHAGGAGHHAQILATVMPAGYFGRMSAG